MTKKAAAKPKVPTTIELGAMSPPISLQIEGLVPRREAKKLDSFAYSITMLKLHELLSPAEAAKARKRLVKLIKDTLERHVRHD